MKFTKSILPALVLLPLLSLAGESSAYADVGFNCEPTIVRERSNRIEVRCSNSVQVGSHTVEAVTYAKTNTAQMERFFRVAISALLGGHKLAVELPVSTSGNLNGCYNACRTITFPFALRD